MIGGVALAAGGFVMAGTVHVFGVKRFHPIVRPAILTAFLGYLLAVASLLFAAAALMVGGLIMNRLDTTLLSWWRYTNSGPIYVPTLPEVIGTLSLISIGVVAFAVIAKNSPVFEKRGHHAPVPAE